MTVGELVYQTAIKDGYNPEEISPELKKIAEVYQRVFDTMREPMKAVSAMAESMQEPIKRIYSVAESVRPQMEALSKIQFPVIPELGTACASMPNIVMLFGALCSAGICV